MKKQWYKFMRPAVSSYGMGGFSNGVEVIQYKNMEFASDADANKYARLVLGHTCFAVMLNDEDLREKKMIEDKFAYSFV